MGQKLPGSFGIFWSWLDYFGGKRVICRGCGLDMVLGLWVWSRGWSSWKRDPTDMGLGSGVGPKRNVGPLLLPKQSKHAIASPISCWPQKGPAGGWFTLVWRRKAFCAVAWPLTRVARPRRLSSAICDGMRIIEAADLVRPRSRVLIGRLSLQRQSMGFQVCAALSCLHGCRK